MKRLTALAVLKLSLYLNEEENPQLFEEYRGLLMRGVTKEKVAGCQELPQYLFHDMPVVAQRYGKLCWLLEGNPAAVTAVQVYLLVCLEPRTLQLLDQCFGISSEGVNIQEAWSIAHREEACIDHIPEIYESFLLVKYLLLADMEEQNFLHAAFYPDPYLAAWLLGEEEMDYILRSFCEVWNINEASKEQVILSIEKENAAEFLERQGGQAILYVSGRTGSGRKFFVHQVARDAGYSVLFVPYGKLVEQEHIVNWIWVRVLRECLLNRRALCITDITAGSGKTMFPKDIFQRVEQEYVWNMPLFLTGSPEIKPAAVFTLPVFFVSIGEYTMEQQAGFWNYFAGIYLEDSADFPVEALASRMRLTARQIEVVMERLAAGMGDGKINEIRDIFRVCYQVMEDGHCQNMHMLSGGYTWEDLKLPPYSKKLLKDLCSQVQCQMTVWNKWGMRRKISYGRCISALFSGPPGTGKTMAAQVIASCLGLDIYRVDLSQITDKYVGETEKHLKDVFDQAERSNMILLFDEADALFGKRTDAGDAMEKYANTQVSYLLQRIEEYTGIVLMTTNLVSNIDRAFLRRFRYHITFQMPGAALRRELWEYMLDESVPKQEIDYEYLASQFELSGAQIKNIALNACYHAAAANEELQMKHLVEGIFQEGQKEGKLMLSEDFGMYGKLLNDLFRLFGQN